VLLFLFIPFSVYLLDLSVQSAESFAAVKQLLDQPLMLAVQLLIIWSIAHHFFAGIRFLLIDAEIGVEKSQARIGSWLVFLAEAIAILLIVVGVYT
jgi:succinate dehydrogenase / fumarate reductase cytochrome b subunit